VLGTLIALAVAPALGALAALAVTRALQRGLRRATRRWRRPVAAGEWVMSAWLAFSHGSNDAQKAVGLLAALLVAGGHLATPSAPLWGVVACAGALTVGTAVGGWKIVKTVGRGIYRIQPVDGLSSQAASAGVIFGASLAGAPVSTSHVVASSIVGAGGGRRRWKHVRWAAVADMALAWAVTIPATAMLGALTFLIYGSLG
jgi:PiT family inorganic phosphate transporter